MLLTSTLTECTMTVQKTTSPAHFLHELIDTSALSIQAIRFGVIKRKRKIDPIAFVVTLVFSMAIGADFSLEELRRTYGRKTGVKISRSAWLGRFNKPTEMLIAWLLGQLQARADQHRPIFKGPLACFADIVLQDSTVIQTRNCLAKIFKGTRKARSSIKVHTRIRALTGELLWHRITKGSAADSKSFAMSHKERGKLFLFDKGYQSASLWWRVHRVGAYFVTRLPASYKPTVKWVNGRGRGRRRNLVGKSLRAQLKSIKRAIIDVDCDFRVHIRGYGGKRGRYEQVPFRVVGIWNVERKCYHLYVTNLPSKRFDALLIGVFYRLRWDVELFYRLGKSGLGLDWVRKLKKGHRVKIVVRAALCRASVAMQARCATRGHIASGRWVNLEAWVKVWRVEMADVALDVLWRHRKSKGSSWLELVEQSLDPNIKRLPLREQFRWQ
jgi:hypothetical protein